MKNKTLLRYCAGLSQCSDVEVSLLFLLAVRIVVLSVVLPPAHTCAMRVCA